MKAFEIKISRSDNGYRRSHKVWSDNADEKFSFRLNECPEDAIIGRDIFDGDDFIRAVELGFRIAQRGYDTIKVSEVQTERGVYANN